MPSRDGAFRSFHGSPAQLGSGGVSVTAIPAADLGLPRYLAEQVPWDVRVGICGFLLGISGGWDAGCGWERKSAEGWVRVFCQKRSRD